MLAGCWDYPARRRKSTGNKKRIDILKSKDGMLHFGTTVVNVLLLVPPIEGRRFTFYYIFLKTEVSWQMFSSLTINIQA